MRRTLFSDDFNRADNVDLGASWDAGYTGKNNLQIVSNSVRSTVVGTDSFESVNAVSVPNDQWAQATIAAITGTAIIADRVLLRAATPATMTWYDIVASRNLAGVRSFIQETVGGVETSIASENVTTWAAADTLAGEVKANVVALYRNGSSTPLLSVANNTIASGRIGAGVFVGSGGALTDAQLDTFSGGDFLGDQFPTAFYRRRPLRSKRRPA